MKLENNYPYETNGGSRLFQCILAGGTAVLSVRTIGASGFTDVKTWSADEVVEVIIPRGEYKVVTTGNAEVTSESL